MPKKVAGAKAGALGAKLRSIRKACHLSMAEVAAQLGWSESTVSRLETGQRGVAAEDVAALAVIYGVTGSERDTLVNMAKTIDEPGWWETAFRGLPQNSVALAKYESDAVAITNWAPLLVPGLLHTLEYGRAYMLADGVPEHEVGSRLMARKRRQNILDGVHYTAYLDETVLRRPIGGRQTLINQLRHLQQVSERVALRIMPVHVGAHSGLIGPFTMMEFDDTPPVVHVELRRSAVFLNGQADTYTYVETLDQLSAHSLDAQESRDRIADAIEAQEGECG